MLTLRLTQHPAAQPGEYLVEVALEGDGLPRQTASAPVHFSLSEQDGENLRWYLEDYLQFPFDPAPSSSGRSFRPTTMPATCGPPCATGWPRPASR